MSLSRTSSLTCGASCFSSPRNPLEFLHIFISFFALYVCLFVFALLSYSVFESDDRKWYFAECLLGGNTQSSDSFPVLSSLPLFCLLKQLQFSLPPMQSIGCIVICVPSCLCTAYEKKKQRKRKQVAVFSICSNGSSQLQQKVFH